MNFRETYTLLKEMVQKHGIIVIRPLGNDGPKHFSVDDFHISNVTFSIGSIITAKIKADMYDFAELIHPWLRVSHLEVPSPGMEDVE